MRVLLYIAVLTIAFGCKKASDRKCFKGLGKIVTEIRNVNSFEKLLVNDHVDLKIVEDTIQWLEIATGENLINHIITLSSNNELKISDENKCSFLRDLSHKPLVILHTPNIKEININGSGNIEFKHHNISSLRINSSKANADYSLDIKCDSLFLDILGTPLFTAKGEADYSYFYHFGSGNFDTKSLVNQESLINWNSTGNLHINSINNLTGQIFSSGNVHLYGNSVENVTTYSSGQLFKED